MSTSNKNDSASKSNNDGVCEVNDMLQNMKTADEEDKVDGNTCANCGKEGSDVTNICNKCQSVKYCNAACKKKHRHKHKKDCEEHLRLAAEQAAKLHDEALFKQPPKDEDCPICFLLMPTLLSGSTYMTCCGKMICSGCMYAPVYDDKGNKVTTKTCPFCRIPAPKSYDEATERIKKMSSGGDAKAICTIGTYYFHGDYGFPQDYTKALELYHRAAELGSAEAYNNIGNNYFNGEGVEVDRKKAIHYWEQAAMKGCVEARRNLGLMEKREGNTEKSLRHYMIALGDGDKKSLDSVQNLFLNGLVTKDVYAKALQAYQVYLSEIKSEQRDKAAADGDKYKYY